MSEEMSIEEKEFLRTRDLERLMKRIRRLERENVMLASSIMRLGRVISELGDVAERKNEDE